MHKTLQRCGSQTFWCCSKSSPVVGHDAPDGVAENPREPTGGILQVKLGCRLVASKCLKMAHRSLQKTLLQGILRPTEVSSGHAVLCVLVDPRRRLVRCSSSRMASILSHSEAEVGGRPSWIVTHSLGTHSIKFS